MYDFLVWDAPEFLTAGQHFLTAILANQELAAVGVRRGTTPGGSASLSIFSFNQDEYTASPDWPKRQALLELLSGEVGEGVERESIGDYMDSLSYRDGEELLLNVNGSPIPASRLEVGVSSWLVWSTDKKFGISVAGTDIELPNLRSVRLGDFDQEQLAELGL